MSVHFAEALLPFSLLTNCELSSLFTECSIIPLSLYEKNIYKIMPYIDAIANHSLTDVDTELHSNLISLSGRCAYYHLADYLKPKRVPARARCRRRGCPRRGDCHLEGPRHVPQVLPSALLPCQHPPRGTIESLAECLPVHRAGHSRGCPRGFLSSRGPTAQFLLLSVLLILVQY